MRRRERDKEREREREEESESKKEKNRKRESDFKVGLCGVSLHILKIPVFLRHRDFSLSVV